MEKRASIGRAALGLSLEYKNHVPVMTVLLAMAWSFGCDKECYIYFWLFFEDQVDALKTGRV